MATTNIELDIENMTGVSDADNQFIISAQKFVVASIPKDLLKWAGTETVASTHGGDDSPTSNNPVTLPVGTDNIISVRRGDNSVEEAPISDRAFLETTSGSLKIPTASFPKYYITAGNKIIVKPNPTDALTARVTYVDFSKLDDNSDLRNAVVFHATSSEFTKLSSAQLPTSAISFNSVPPDTPSLTTVSYSGPVSDLDAASPTFTTATLLASSVYTGSAPTYTKPTITTKVSFEDFWEAEEDSNPFGDNDPGALSISAATPVQPDIPNFTFSVATALPSYTSPTVGSASESLTTTMDADSAGYGTDADFLNFSKWFSVAGEFIEDEEDSELAAVQLNKISTYISAYSQSMQDKLNSFNTKLQTYQAELQKELQEAQYEQQSEHQSSLQQYQAEIGAYSADVNKEVQEYQQKLSRYSNELNMAFQAWSKTESDNISVFQADISNELNEYNKELSLYQTAVQESMQEIQVTNQVNIAQAQSDLQVSIGNEDRSQQRQLQNAVNNMQSIINDNNSLLQKYQAEASTFSAEVNNEIQEYQTKIQISQKYGMDAEKYYKWAQSEVSSYVQNNSKMLATMMASKGGQKD